MSELPDELIINGVRYVRADRPISTGRFAPSRSPTVVTEAKRGKVTYGPGR